MSIKTSIARVALISLLAGGSALAAAPAAEAHGFGGGHFFHLPGGQGGFRPSGFGGGHRWGGYRHGWGFRGVGFGWGGYGHPCYGYSGCYDPALCCNYGVY